MRKNNIIGITEEKILRFTTFTRKDGKRTGFKEWWSKILRAGEERGSLENNGL